MSEAVKVKYVKPGDLLKIAPDCGKGQGARSGSSKHWDRSAIMGNMLTTGGYAKTEGPLVGFEDELAGEIPGAERTFADGNLRCLAILDALKLEADGKTTVKVSDWDIPVVIYPKGLPLEERERIRNRSRDTTVPKTRHDFEVWGLKLALKQPLMGDTELCRLFGPRSIRAVFDGAVVAGSTYIDANGVERFLDGLPLTASGGAPAMLVNKQGPIQEITRVRSLPAFAREFFLLHPSESKHKPFSQAREWSQEWAKDIRDRKDLASVQSLKELLDKYPESKLGIKVAAHMAAGKPDRKAGREAGKGAFTSAERERLANTFAQTGNDGSKVARMIVAMIGREVGAPGLDEIEAILAEAKFSPKGKELIDAAENSAVKVVEAAKAAATESAQRAAEAKAKAEAAAVKKARKG